jgi:hypothetical protein
MDLVEALVVGQPVCANQLRALHNMLLHGELVMERTCQVGVFNRMPHGGSTS